VHPYSLFCGGGCTFIIKAFARGSQPSTRAAAADTQDRYFMRTPALRARCSRRLLLLAPVPRFSPLQQVIGFHRTPA
jgi:hypothetical protein